MGMSRRRPPALRARSEIDSETETAREEKNR